MKFPEPKLTGFIFSCLINIIIIRSQTSSQSHEFLGKISGKRIKEKKITSYSGMNQYRMIHEDNTLCSKEN